MFADVPRLQLFALCSILLASIAAIPLLIAPEQSPYYFLVKVDSTKSILKASVSNETTHKSSLVAPKLASSSEKLTIWMKKPVPAGNADKMIVAEFNSTNKMYSIKMNVSYKIGFPNVSFAALEQPSNYLTLFCDDDDEPDCSRYASWLLSTSLVDVTRWNEKLQVHESLNHTRVNGLPQRMLKTKCHAETCPKSCQEGYLWDRIDNLCKPIYSEQDFVGRCRCHTTCFTPAAVQPNSTYPWKNLSQKEEFYPPNGNVGLVKRSEGRNERKKHTYKPRFQCDVNQNTTLPQSIRSSFQHYLFFIPEFKLIFCGIPKSGISEWLRFFRYSMGAKDYLSWGHFKSDLAQFHVGSLSTSKAQELLFRDPSWTKAVFFRDPAERLLSGYLNKIVGEEWSQSKYGKNYTMSFAEFVNRITKSKPTKCKTEHSGIDEITGLNTCTDPHFRPQMLSCGLDHLLPAYDFIGSFQHISKHTKLLLKKVGMWDEYGSKYDDGNGAMKGSLCMRPSPIREANFTPDGFNQLSRIKNRTTSHATQSSKKMSQYYTPELLSKVKKAFHWDYAIWDDLVERPPHSVATGKDLDLVRSYCSNAARKSIH